MTNFQRANFPVYSRGDRIETRIPINAKKKKKIPYYPTTTTNAIRMNSIPSTLRLHLTYRMIIDLFHVTISVIAKRESTRNNDLFLSNVWKMSANTNRMGMIDSRLTTNSNQCFIHREERYFSLLFRFQA